MSGYQGTRGQRAISERSRTTSGIIDRDVDCGSGNGDPYGRGSVKDFFCTFIWNVIGVNGRLDLREEVRRGLVGNDYAKIFD
jgi:hypothetical protein